MSGRRQRKTVVITSVVLGVVSMILMTIMKRSVYKIPLIRKFLKFKNIGLDSMKDFLEISELNYRIAAANDKLEKTADNEMDSDEEGFSNYAGFSNPKSKETTTETIVVWEGDESQLYTIFVSSDPIAKHLLFGEDRIPLLNNNEIDELTKSSNWIRRILVGYNPPSKNPIESEAAEKKFDEFSEERAQGDVAENDTMSGIHSGNTRTDWKIPFAKFYSRLKSSNGRVSKEISHPSFRKDPIKIPEVETRLTKAGRDYFLDIKENETEMTSHIYDYQVLLYVINGQGLKVRVPSFTSETTVSLGHLPPSLCYLTGVREIGVAFEQFVGWIEEENVLTLDGELDQYLDPDFKL